MTPGSHTVLVRLPRGEDRSYRIVIRPGCREELPALLRPLVGEGKAFILSDATVARLYGRKIRARLAEAGIPAVLVHVPPGEGSKNASVLHGLQTALIEEGVKRGSLIVALGGGVVGDLAGFAAATILRGIRFLQVPTTLLAQVDSSTGGKVGIDHPRGKNLIGAFHQPSAVWIDPEFLQTLPSREFSNGMAEIVKIALALDASFFRLLERNVERIGPRRREPLPGIIARAVGLKASVVEQDERETGLRKVLNLGHTIGHAVEAATEFRVPHGFAVAIGLAAEARIALRLGLMKKTELGRLLRLLRGFGLPTEVPSRIHPTAFHLALRADKKSGAEGPAFVLPAGIGISALDVSVEETLLAEVTGVGP